MSNYYSFYHPLSVSVKYSPMPSLHSKGGKLHLIWLDGKTCFSCNQYKEQISHFHCFPSGFPLFEVWLARRCKTLKTILGIFGLFFLRFPPVLLLLDHVKGLQSCKSQRRRLKQTGQHRQKQCVVAIHREKKIMFFFFFNNAAHFLKVLFNAPKYCCSFVN